MQETLSPTYLDSTPHAETQRDARILLMTYAILIIVGAIYPGGLDWDVWKDRGISLFENTHWFQLKYIGWTDLIINVFGFFPVGFLMVWGFSGTRVPIILAFLSGIFVSFLLELSQTFLPSRVPSLWDHLFNLVGISIGIGLGFSLKLHRFGFILRGMGLWLSALSIWLLAQWAYQSHVMPFLPRHLYNWLHTEELVQFSIPENQLGLWIWIEMILSAIGFYILRLTLLSLIRPGQKQILCTIITYVVLFLCLWRYQNTHPNIPQYTEFFLLHLMALILPPWYLNRNPTRHLYGIFLLIVILFFLYFLSLFLPYHPYITLETTKIARNLTNVKGLALVCTVVLPFWLMTLLVIRLFEMKRK